MRLGEEAKERIRRSYSIDEKSMRRIAQEEGYSRPTIEKAIANQLHNLYRLTRQKPLRSLVATCHEWTRCFWKMTAYRASNAIPFTGCLR